MSRLSQHRPVLADAAASRGWASAPDQIRALGGRRVAVHDPGRQSLFAASCSTISALLAQDDWRMRPNFTLSFGLRYEWQTIISDHGDFAPRIGFAWAPG